MGLEIERKYLVDVNCWNKVNKPKGKELKQCYLSTDPEKTIRVRTKGNEGFLTVKGKVKGLSRLEYEYPIPVEDAKDMMVKLGDNPIEKVRYEITVGQHVWEVDVFEGVNQGLIVAEIELSSENETFEIPEWVGKEVSTEAKYFNSNLQEHPYNQW